MNALKLAMDISLNYKVSPRQLMERQCLILVSDGYTPVSFQQACEHAYLQGEIHEFIDALEATLEDEDLLRSWEEIQELRKKREN